MTISADPWADWILKHRYGGAEGERHRMMAALAPVRAKVLENAEPKAGQTLLDVGCGDGLIGFGALEKLGPDGSVIFSDISQKLLDACREAAEGMGVAHQCSYVNADATDLSAISDRSVDMVTTRSVLIYVADKQKALNEFFRVLQPGGWLSIFEPVAKVYKMFQAPGTWMGLNVFPIRTEMNKVMEAWKENESTQDTMGDFDDRDMVRMAQAAGFEEMHLDLTIQVRKGSMFSTDWQAFLHSSPNPLAPTFLERISRALSAEEIKRVEECVRPQVEAGEGRVTQSALYLKALKPELR